MKRIFGKKVPFFGRRGINGSPMYGQTSREFFKSSTKMKPIEEVPRIQ